MTIATVCALVVGCWLAAEAMAHTYPPTIKDPCIVVSCSVGHAGSDTCLQGPGCAENDCMWTHVQANVNYAKCDDTAEDACSQGGANVICIVQESGLCAYSNPPTNTECYCPGGTVTATDSHKRHC